MTESPNAAPEHWIAVARLLRPQGRRGELLADPLTDLSGVFIAGRELRLAASPQAAPTGEPKLLEDVWRPQGRNAGRLVLKLSGTDSISAAELLEGKELFLRQSDLPALDPGTFMVRDLVGCSLLDGGRVLGEVVDLQFPVGPDGRTRLQDAPDLLAVMPLSTTPPADAAEITAEPEPVLVPFVKAWLESVDLDAKQIRMHLPPGLFDEPE